MKHTAQMESEDLHLPGAGSISVEVIIPQQCLDIMGPS